MRQNAALVEDMAAAAVTLNGQACDLVSTVSAFKLDSGSARIALVSDTSLSRLRLAQAAEQ